MKILLICAGGMSTGMLVNKMNRYFKGRGESAVIRACGLTDYMNEPDDYDIVLAAPQVAYRLNKISQDLKKPAEAIPSSDYAGQCCDHIYDLVMKMAGHTR